MTTRVTVTFQMDIEHADEKSLEEFENYTKKRFTFSKAMYMNGISYIAEIVDGTVSVKPV